MIIPDEARAIRKLSQIGYYRLSGFSYPCSRPRFDYGVHFNALNSDKDDIITLIYMRRHFELTDDKGDAYQVLSNLLHKRERAIDTREPKGTGENHPEMEGGKFSSGCDQLINVMPSFSYSDMLHRVEDKDSLKSLYESCSNGYEKLQVCRLIEHEENNAVVEKSIKQTYHIENEFICQLDLAEFDTIPEYVISKCDAIVSGDSA
ncbi:MAG: hypothetical protein WGN25_15795 [Candidatus Electrothrix sp. GW3-4]|uniref:hypothetical protein n=1 Tax=Candidatus Electrothrix sp. GW3-4 TaxID=3126740 RepID=UPI0030D270C2